MTSLQNDNTSIFSVVENLWTKSTDLEDYKPVKIDITNLFEQLYEGTTVSPIIDIVEI